MAREPFVFDVIEPKRVRVSGPISDEFVNEMYVPGFEIQENCGVPCALVPVEKLREAESFLNVRSKVPERLVELLQREYVPVEPPTLKLPMFDYQKEAVSRMIAMRRVMLFDAPGMGKTAQALAFASHFGKNVLIVAPTSNQRQWDTEGTQKFLGVPATVLTSHNYYEPLLDASKNTTDPKYFIVTYDGGRSTKSLCEPLRSVDWETVIFDEAHRFKTPTSLTTKKWLLESNSVGVRAKQVAFLTGTPLSKERASELFGMMTCCFPELKMSTWFRGAFATRYCDPKIEHGKWVAEGVSHVDELKALLNTRMLRRPKELYLRHLPSKTRRVQYVDLSPEDRFTYKKENALLAEYMRQLKNATNSRERSEATMRIRSHASHMRQIVGNLKSKYVAAYMRENDFNVDYKTIYFCEHAVVRDALMDACDQDNVGAVAIYGDVSAEDRLQSVEFLRDENDPDVRIGVFSIMAAGVGLNCAPGVRKCVFAELPWNSTDADQCEDRAHRVGTKYPIDVVYFVARDTIDQDVVRMHMRKSRAINSIIDDGILPDRTYDSELIMRAVDFGLDAVLARDLERENKLILDPSKWNDSSVPPAEKTYVPMKRIPEGWFEWDGVSVAGTRWIESEKEFTCVSEVPNNQPEEDS